MEDKCIAVIAGTPIDTKMGVDFFLAKGLVAQGFPISCSPEEQSRLQILSQVQLKDEVCGKLIKIKNQGISRVCVYCNSLSAAVDMEELAEKFEIKIITPLQVYRQLAPNYSLLGVLAANNQSAAGIERTIQSVNSNCLVVGIGILPLVQEIEKKTPPSEIINKFGLQNVIDFFAHLGVEAIILGCTHFPYLSEQLRVLTKVKLIDPAEIMAQNI